MQNPKRLQLTKTLQNVNQLEQMYSTYTKIHVLLKNFSPGKQDARDARINLGMKNKNCISTYSLIRHIHNPCKKPSQKKGYIFLQLVNEQFKCKFLRLLSLARSISFIPYVFPFRVFHLFLRKIFQNVNASI